MPMDNAGQRYAVDQRHHKPTPEAASWNIAREFSAPQQCSAPTGNKNA